MASLSEWFYGSEPIRSIVSLHWERLPGLYIGERLALAALLIVVFVAWVAAINRIFAGEFGWPKPRKSVRTPRRKKGFGVKHLVLVLIALLPGGLAGTVAVYAVMGKENWRSDAFWIFGVSLAPALLLALLRAEWFPWPQLSDSVYLSGLLGLIFALLQVWALIKLLREWWGEPEECVAWWPPAVLWMQSIVLAACVVRILT